MTDRLSPDAAPSERLQHHLEGMQAAFRELYPEGEILTWGSRDLAALVRGDLVGAHTISMRTTPPEPLPDGLKDVPLLKKISESSDIGRLSSIENVGRKMREILRRWGLS